MCSQKEALPERSLLEQELCGACQLIYDEKLTIQYANTAFFRLMGGTDQPGASLYELLEHKEFKRLFNAVKSEIDQGNTVFDLENSVKMHQGQFSWLLAKCSYHRDNGRIDCIFIDFTKQKQRWEVLRVNEEISRIAVAQNNILILRYHIPTRTLRCPAEISEKFCVPPAVEDWPQAETVSRMVPEPFQRVYIRFFEEMAEGRPAGSTVVQMQDCKGRVGWYHWDYTLILDLKGAPLYSVISFYDMTEQREKELAYEKWKQVFESQRPDSIGFYEANVTAGIIERMEGDLHQTLCGGRIVDMKKTVDYAAEQLVYEEDREEYRRVLSQEYLLQQYAAGVRELKIEHRRVDADGTPYWARLGVQMFPDPYSEDVKAFGVIRNIDAEKKNLLDLEKRSTMDELTGIFNRVTAIEKINGILKEAPEGCHVLVMVDIDYFKQLNDSFGHVYGDKVLWELAQELRKHVRQEDIVGRLGGDEFILCLKDVCGRQAVEERLGMLCRAISKQYGEAAATASMGAAVFPQDGESFEMLYRRADKALYRAKGSGRNQYAVYKPEFA